MLGRWALPVLLVAGGLMGGCSTAIHVDSAQGAQISDPGFELAWPPVESSPRSVSGDEVVVDGADFDVAGGAAIAAGSSLQLGPDSGGLCYALYSLGGFVGDVHLDSVTVSDSVTPVAEGDGTALYIGLSNYAKGYWEWYVAAPTITFQPPDLSDYLSPAGVVHVAAALGGPGTATVAGLTFARSAGGAAIPAPQNLTGQAFNGRIALAWDPVPSVDGYNVYRCNQPDFARASKLNAQPVSDPSYLDTTVTYTWRYYYWVTAAHVGESAPSAMLSIVSAGIEPAAPQNLTGTGTVAHAILSWDAVPGADHYDVYRSTTTDFTGALRKITPTNSYTDFGMAIEDFYYYEVRTFDVAESAPSNVVRVWVPGANLPTPQNFHVATAESSGDYVTFAWDWSDPEPAGFKVWIGTEPDFDLADAYVFQQVNIDGTREMTEYNLPSGVNLYARLAAVDNDNKLGQLTDELPFQVATYWQWTEVTQFDSPVTGIFDAVVVNGEIVVAYYSSGNIKVARRAADGSWTTETSDLQNTISEAGIAYGGGQYLLGTLAPDPLKQGLWVSTGTSGSWSTKALEDAAFSFHIAASDTEFATTYQHTNATGSELILQTRPISGTNDDWLRTNIRNPITPPLISDLAFKGSDLYCLLADGNDLLLGDRDALFNWAAIATTPGGYSDYAQLLDYGGNLVTLSYSAGQERLDYVHGSGSSWITDTAVEGSGPLHDPAAVVLGSELMAIYRTNAFTVPWRYSVFDGTSWNSGRILIQPDLEFNSTLVNLGGLPYLIYTDANDGIHCAQGVPPGA